MSYNYSSDELYHHGIKGQKWGVRRYQNPDGSLTQEGYQHWGLNPDGSKLKDKHGKGVSENTRQKTKLGAALGTAAGVGLAVATGGASAGVAAGVAAATSISGGMFVGTMGGKTLGAIQTHAKQNKIRSLLKEKGKVYVKDL